MLPQVRSAVHKMTTKTFAEMKKIHFLGLANAGKSTVLNQLLKNPICNTSKLAQTTREQMRYLDPVRSICYIDSPGLVKKQMKVEADIKKVPWKIHADYVFFVVDATQKSLDQYVVDELKKIEIPIYAIYNKMDLVDSTATLMKFPVDVVKSIKITAIENGIAPLIEELDKISNPDQNNNTMEFYSNQKIAEEVIREQLYQNVYSYIPYVTKQRTMSFIEESDKIHMIHELQVPRLCQAKIVKGMKGRVVKSMQSLAINKIRNLTGKTTKLDLLVTVKK